VAAGCTGAWSPLTWKSTRLKRVVGSTLAAETFSMLGGLRELEWVVSLSCEVLYSDYKVENRETFLKNFRSWAVTDCKSCYDHLVAPGVSTARDRESALDVIVLKEIQKRLATAIRWAPGLFQLADILTKDHADAADFFRATARSGKYCLGQEEEALARRAREKQRRKKRGEDAMAKNLQKQAEAKESRRTHADKAEDGGDIPPEGTQDKQ
jgi:hypothetical protein